MKTVKFNKNEYQLLYEVVVGSHAYNLNDEKSDLDVQGIFLVPEREYLNLYPNPPKQNIVTTKELDVTYYSLRRFFELIGSANPNFIEFLYTPDDCIRYKDPVMDVVFENRSIFITQKVFYTYGAYALSQIKKAKGQNKWASNPKPKEMPKLEDFCSFIPFEDLDGNEFKGRPKTLKDCCITLENYNASKVEGGHNLFRIYYYGDEAKGVLKNNQVVCTSIPKEDENNRFEGVLIINEDSYKKEKKDWKNYWQWMENRNEARWSPEGAKETEINYKNMSHCVRLLYSAINIFKNGEPIVRLDDEKRQMVLDIKKGQWYYGDIMKLVNELEKEFNDSFEIVKEKKLLPHHLDMEKVNDLYLDVTAMIK